MVMSFIFNSQKLERTQMSITRGADKRGVPIQWSTGAQ